MTKDGVRDFIAAEYTLSENYVHGLAAFARADAYSFINIAGSRLISSFFLDFYHGVLYNFDNTP